MVEAKETVLFFVWSTVAACADRILGARRFAEMRGWRIQAVERGGMYGKIPIKDLLAIWRPVGCIAECGCEIPELSVVHDAGIPLVRMDADPASRRGRLHVVRSDSEQIGTMAAKELLSDGFRNFAFLDYPIDCHWAHERRRAFESVLRLHGCTCTVFETPLLRRPFLRHGLVSKWIAALPKPCGVFAANDIVGNEVLCAAKELELSVPRDIAVVGVDDDRDLCENAYVPLTSIRPDFEKGGFLCAELLARLISNPKLASVDKKFGVAYVARRESTGRARRISFQVSKAISFIRLNATNRIGLRDVAAVMGCSGRTVEDRFAKEVGHSVLSEITAVRIARAKEELAHSKESIAYVAALCGWGSPSAFRAAFVASVGCTPLVWRRNCWKHLGG